MIGKPITTWWASDGTVDLCRVGARFEEAPNAARGLPREDGRADPVEAAGGVHRAVLSEGRSRSPAVSARGDAARAKRCSRRSTRTWASLGHRLKTGMIVDASIITAPSSTKNRTGERDPEMHQTKKGDQWYFGMKAHIGVDAQSGLAHSSQRRSGMASQRPSRGGEGPCLHRPRTRQSDLLRGLRPHRQCRLGQCRCRPRHRGVRRAHAAPLVVADGTPHLSQRQASADHRRRGRFEQQPQPVVEVRVAEAGRTRWGWGSRCVTSRPAPASGTRSSTGCSVTSPRTGGAGRW